MSESHNKFTEDIHTDLLKFQPIGYMKSCFTQKNGTPRQGSILNTSRGSLTIEKVIFNNPEHSLQDLEAYSHIWIIYIFHKNSGQSTRAKVAPPRLDGQKIGVYASRSPHRPNAIGLTLASLVGVVGATISVSGIDLIDGTPVIDIKPYIPQYDSPMSLASPILQKYLEGQSEDSNNVSSDDSSLELTRKVTTASWISEAPAKKLIVSFHPRTNKQLELFSNNSENEDYRLQFMKGPEEVKSAIEKVLTEDPRSSYRRTKCKDQLYYFNIEIVHVTAWFNEDEVEVLSIKSMNKVSIDK